MLPVVFKRPCVFELKEQGDSSGPSDAGGARGCRTRRETWPAECGQPGLGGAECVKRKPGFDRSNYLRIEHPAKSHIRYVSVTETRYWN